MKKPDGGYYYYYKRKHLLKYDRRMPTIANNREARYQAIHDIAEEEDCYIQKEAELLKLIRFLNETDL